MYMSIIMTTNAAADTIMKSMSITTITSAAADTIMKSMNITTTMSAAAEITITITITMQMRYLQAGDVRLLKSIPERILKRSLLPFLSQGSMA